jgi:hypothetical protein
MSRDARIHPLLTTGGEPGRLFFYYAGDMGGPQRGDGSAEHRIVYYFGPDPETSTMRKIFVPAAEPFACQHCGPILQPTACAGALM